MEIIKTFFITCQHVIESPSKFFEYERPNFTGKKTLTHLSFLTAFFAIFQIIFFVLTLMFVNLKNPELAKTMLPGVLLINIFISVLIFFIIAFVQALIIFLLQKLVKCQLRLEDVFTVSVYSMTPLLLAALPIGQLKALVPVWQITILALGVKEFAKINNAKLPTIIVPYLLIVLISVFVYYQKVVLPQAKRMSEEIAKKVHLQVLLSEADGWKPEQLDNGKIIRRQYYGNGRLEREICNKNQCADSKKDIEWEKFYNEKGVLISSKDYLDDGKVKIVKNYWDDGTLKEESRYENKKLVKCRGAEFHYGIIKKKGKRFAGDISKNTKEEAENFLDRFHSYIKTKQYEDAGGMLSDYMKNACPLEKVFSGLDEKYGSEEDFTTTKILFDADIEKIKKPEDKTDYDFYDSILSEYISKRQEDILLRIGVKKKNGSLKISSMSWGIRGVSLSGYEEPEEKVNLEEQVLKDYGWHLDKTELLEFKSVSTSPEYPMAGGKIKVLLVIENAYEEPIPKIRVGVREDSWGAFAYVSFFPKEIKKVMVTLSAAPNSQTKTHHFNVETEYRNKVRVLSSFDLTVEGK